MVIDLSMTQAPSSPRATSAFRNEPKHKSPLPEHENIIKNNTAQKDWAEEGKYIEENTSGLPHGCDQLEVNAFLVHNRVWSKGIFFCFVRPWSSKSFYKTATKNVLHSWEANKIENSL